jgi:hypothetical protein
LIAIGEHSPAPSLGPVLINVLPCARNAHCSAETSTGNGIERRPGRPQSTAGGVFSGVGPVGDNRPRDSWTRRPLAEIDDGTDDRGSVRIV